ncbi:cupin domain-containing protein [Streptomyces sp. NPDC039016]|uniref:JmjC domain-containing protein n=1 Tax=Streptomyces sp. NPDC039016 TaxID=3154330 RepID=UPI0034093A6F
MAGSAARVGGACPCARWSHQAAIVVGRAAARFRTRARTPLTAEVSQAGDASLGRHDEDWDGIIVQLEGAKRWRVWADPEDGPTEIVTRVGDMLVLPRGVPHDVDTPGRSLHLAFAVTHQRRPVEPPLTRM